MRTTPFMIILFCAFACLAKAQPGEIHQAPQGAPGGKSILLEWKHPSGEKVEVNVPGQFAIDGMGNAVLIEDSYEVLSMDGLAAEGLDPDLKVPLPAVGGAPESRSVYRSKQYLPEGMNVASLPNAVRRSEVFYISMRAGMLSEASEESYARISIAGCEFALEGREGGAELVYFSKEPSGKLSARETRLFYAGYPPTGESESGPLLLEVNTAEGVWSMSSRGRSIAENIPLSDESEYMFKVDVHGEGAFATIASPALFFERPDPQALVPNVLADDEGVEPEEAVLASELHLRLSEIRMNEQASSRERSKPE